MRQYGFYRRWSPRLGAEWRRRRLARTIQKMHASGYKGTLLDTSEGKTIYYENDGIFEEIENMRRCDAGENMRRW